MPIVMGDYIQSVIIQEMMYVGGGFASRTEMYIVMTYNVISQEWSQLPQYIAYCFAMTAIHNKLTLVGGCVLYSEFVKNTNVLGVWDADRRKWTHPYTPMPTPRYNSSAAVYRQWLIVAGGWSGRTVISSVEVLDTTTNQWFTASSTPVPWCSMRSAVVGDTWYLIGGDANKVHTGATDQVYSVSLSALISCASNTSERIWSTISSLGLCHSTPVCMGESLLAVGGRKTQLGKTVSTILHFIPDRNEWREVGQLPSALCKCTCTPTSNNQLFLAGGPYHTDKVYIGKF